MLQLAHERGVPMLTFRPLGAAASHLSLGLPGVDHRLHARRLCPFRRRSLLAHGLWHVFARGRRGRHRTLGCPRPAPAAVPERVGDCHRTCDRMKRMSSHGRVLWPLHTSCGVSRNSVWLKGEASSCALRPVALPVLGEPVSRHTPNRASLTPTAWPSTLGAT